MGQGKVTVQGHQVKDSEGLSSAMTEGGASKSVHQFKWNQQGNRVLEQLRALYNQPEVAGVVLGLQPDVALVSSDGGCVEAHRLVLTLCSAYFQELFLKVSQVTSPKIKDGPAVVVLGNVKTHQLQQLLQFLYTGEVTVPSDQLEEFLQIGNAFQIEEIIDYSGSKEDPSATGTQSGSDVILNVGDTKTKVLMGVSKEVKESPVASSSTSILYEDVADEDMNISYDIYPVKDEGESEANLDPLGDSDSNDHHEDPTWSGEDNQSSSASEMEDQEENDPTYEEKSVKTKRRRRTSGLDGLLGKRRPTRKGEWEVQEPVSDETLKLEWRVRNENSTAITYYCAFGGGRRCPARLKNKTLNDGTVEWLNNKTAHAPHPKSPRLVQGSDWKVQDPVTDDILQLNWRFLRNRRLESGCVATNYYCVTGGRQCPAKLKKKVLNDGTVVWLANESPHNFHPDTDSSKHKQSHCKPKLLVSYLKNSLTPEQHHFVMQCLEGGVSAPNDILLKFKVQGITPPEEQHLRAFLRNHQRTKK